MAKQPTYNIDLGLVHILVGDLQDQAGIRDEQRLQMTEEVFQKYEPRQDWIKRFLVNLRSQGGC